MSQVAQRGCGPSIPANIQKLPGHGPGQLTLSDPTSARGLDKVTFRGPCQPQPSCDSVKADLCLSSVQLQGLPIDRERLF